MTLKTMCLFAAPLDAAALTGASVAGAPVAGPVTFETGDIDMRFNGGYAVAVADFNKDGKLDVIANSLSVREVGCYEMRRTTQPRADGCINVWKTASASTAASGPTSTTIDVRT